MESSSLLVYSTEYKVTGEGTIGPVTESMYVVKSGERDEEETESMART